MAKRITHKSSPPKERRAIAERWRAFRESMDKSQDEWAKLLKCTRTRVYQLEKGKVAISADDLAVVSRHFPQLNVVALLTGIQPSDYPTASFQQFLGDLTRAADGVAAQEGRVLTAWRHDHAQILHLYEALKGRNLKPADPQARELISATLRGLMSRI